MWHQDYFYRLQEWHNLRTHCQEFQLPLALSTIDSWWQQTPWQPYYLHWDDSHLWPGPWDLLNDNVYCDLARALGIVYTVSMMDRDDIADMELADTDQGNLVLVNQGKYILNWPRGRELNIPSKQFTIKQSLDSRVLHY
jgi:hypothetical protein